MTISEESRHRLFGRLEEVLGGQEASTLMEHLSPLPWTDVATRRDLEPLATRAEMAEQFSALRLEMAEQFGAFRIELAEQLGALRLETAEQMGSLRAEVHGGARSLVLGMMGLQISAAALVVGASKLL